MFWDSYCLTGSNHLRYWHQFTLSTTTSLHCHLAVTCFFDITAHFCLSKWIHPTALSRTPEHFLHRQSHSGNFLWVPSHLQLSVWGGGGHEEFWSWQACVCLCACEVEVSRKRGACVHSRAPARAHTHTKKVQLEYFFLKEEKYAKECNFSIPTMDNPWRCYDTHFMLLPKCMADMAVKQCASIVV
jgi:hypothetical protein